MYNLLSWVFSLFIQLQEEKQKKEETEKKVQTLQTKTEKVCVFNLFTSEEHTLIILLGLRKGTVIMVRKSNANKENNYLLLIYDLIKCQIIVDKIMYVN